VGGRQVYVRDLNSANGTFLKVDGVTRLIDGDVLRMGNQALRFGLVEAPVHSEVLKAATGCLQADRVAVAVTAAQGEVVVFQNREQTCPFKPGQTVCDVALKAGCHKGIFGSDPVRIVAGQEHLHPITDDERETLEDICGVDPASHRLACRARPTGPLVVDVVDQ
jgi:ferredoxin